MHFHLFGPPPPHLLPIILSSALAFAGGAYLMSQQRLPSRLAALQKRARELLEARRVASTRSDGFRRDDFNGVGLASRMFSRANGRTDNAVFDDFRAATPCKFDTEAREFSVYLDGLRRTRDAAEFETFLKNRKDGERPAG